MSIVNNITNLTTVELFETLARLARQVEICQSLLSSGLLKYDHPEDGTVPSGTHFKVGDFLITDLTRVSILSASNEAVKMDIGKPHPELTREYIPESEESST